MAGSHPHAPLIARFVDLVLGHIGREYPSKLDHVITGPPDLRTPRQLHPIFYGSFDWHSCVHGHWLLARALRLCPDLPQREAVRATLDERLTAGNVAAEVAYLNQPGRTTFERPYGWAWMLKLGAELHAGGFKHWQAALAPLVQAFVDRFAAYLPSATYPNRVGTHGSTAFALTLALDYARAAGLESFEWLLVSTARRWYEHDADYQAWEPSGVDFLSPGLMEAECMRRVLGPAEFTAWFTRFLPRLHLRQPATLFTPARVSDRTDGHIAHLDGLNLSRAWCWRAIGAVLPVTDPRRAIAAEAYRMHVDSAMPHLAADYAGEHWLATFAMLVLTE